MLSEEEKSSVDKKKTRRVEQQQQWVDVVWSMLEKLLGSNEMMMKIGGQLL